MDVSVIIPTYNRRKLLSYTLNSLIPGLHRGVDMEVLVVDDGSTDDTVEYVKASYPWVQLLKNKSKGAASARNTALALANGRYIHYLDSDDIIGPDFYKSKVAFLDANKDRNACYCDYEFFSSDGEDYAETVMFKHKYNIEKYTSGLHPHLLNYLRGSFLPCNAILWSKDILLKCNGQDESLKVNQDVDLFIRAIFNGLSISYLPDGTRAYVRHHEMDERVGSVSGSAIKFSNILALRESVYENMEKYGYSDEAYKEALSEYIFDYWKELRHSNKEIAERYLQFSKKVYWPVKIRGKFAFRFLGSVLGPVWATRLKYLIYKRNF